MRTNTDIEMCTNTEIDRCTNTDIEMCTTTEIQMCTNREIEMRTNTEIEKCTNTEIVAQMQIYVHICMYPEIDWVVYLSAVCANQSATHVTCIVTNFSVPIDMYKYSSKFKNRKR